MGSRRCPAPLSPPGGWRMAGKRGRSSGPASTPGCWRRFRLHAGSPQLPQRHCNPGCAFGRVIL
ncbi:hypothetical protein V8C44DRAFT_319030 [Trichoderma aethiopicum]